MVKKIVDSNKTW